MYSKKEICKHGLANQVFYGVERKAYNQNNQLPSNSKTQLYLDKSQVGYLRIRSMQLHVPIRLSKYPKGEICT